MVVNNPYVIYVPKYGSRNVWNETNQAFIILFRYSVSSYFSTPSLLLQGTSRSAVVLILDRKNWSSYPNKRYTFSIYTLCTSLPFFYIGRICSFGIQSKHYNGLRNIELVMDIKSLDKKVATSVVTYRW